MSQAVEVLGADGPFAKRIDGFRPRAGQRAMAAAVEAAIARRAVLVCEAGTGTGKTLAYLAPALLSRKKVVVSTGTKNLQDQLYHRDVPLARRALAIGARTALLKGRGNYLCLQRLEVAEHAMFTTDSERAALARIRAWSKTTASGDLDEHPVLSERSPLLPRITSTVDNCLGADCAFYARCFVLKARRAAIEADLVVVNHSLFFADMVLREEGFGELLPGAEVLILDEAHQLPEVATRFFGVRVGSGQLRELARDAAAAGRLEAGDTPAPLERAAALEDAVDALEGALGGEPRRAAWTTLAGALRAPVLELAGTLARLAEALDALAERGRALASCRSRAIELARRLAHVTGADQPGEVRWLEVRGRRFAWHATPLEIGPSLAARVYGEPAAWVFTSATLSVDGSLEHFAARLGLDHYAGQVFASPFDYARRSLCYLPPGLPDPNEPGYTERALAAVLPVLEASRGRAFLLFTSHAALARAARWLEAGSPFPLLVQGTAPRSELLRRFRETPGAVLLGTSSFWEGVDVRGDALACVVIDRLPFAAPDDPVLRARLEALAAAGEDPFRRYQLPQAVIGLKQGAGRLIRDELDYGVLVVCDPRLTRRGYGRVFLDSLPPMPIARELDGVRRFFAGHRRLSAESSHGAHSDVVEAAGHRDGH